MASLYDQSIPVFATSGAYADEKGISHDDLLSYRLVPDQRPSRSMDTTQTHGDLHLGLRNSIIARGSSADVRLGSP
ncbi:hypothetical protein PG993_009694 [Apiospora rasikravindrae]|uniref:Uncharacterized protein n=1 Tax=Apiospora rasikravindrae TaxID=990691 RepID=A0ABR1SLW8_9PEZI